MDIRDWPVERIMQLPDCCFGQRWPISAAQTAIGISISFGISMQAIPERCVIWEVVYQIVGVIKTTCHFDMRLSDVVPIDNDSWMQMERLIPGIGRYGPEGENTLVCSGSSPYRLTMKKPVQSGGQRICGRFEFTVATPSVATSTVIVSSIPREIPDCLVSDILRSR